jgi:hypothetical protein
MSVGVSYPAGATNFASLTSEQNLAWSRDFWREARRLSFINKYLGKGQNAVIQRVTELTKAATGQTGAVMTLTGLLSSSGTIGDNVMEGNEEAMAAYTQRIQLDHLRHAVQSAGKLAEQKTVVSFREEARDRLAYWAADTLDQVAFHMLSGIPFYKKLNGAARTFVDSDNNWKNFEFAPPNMPNGVAANVAWYPTKNRCLRAVSIGGSTDVLEDGVADFTFLGTGGYMTDPGAIYSDTGQFREFGTTDTMRPLTYADIVNLKAIAKDRYIKPVLMDGGKEMYILFVSPQGYADLRLDADFIANVRSGWQGAKDQNPLFAGMSDGVMVDGVLVVSTQYVFTNRGKTNADTVYGGFGGAADDDFKTQLGQRAVFVGAQALGFADIGVPEWNEMDHYDYKDKPRIGTAKIFGLVKPKFTSSYTGLVEDFAVITIDTGLTR